MLVKVLFVYITYNLDVRLKSDIASTIQQLFPNPAQRQKFLDALSANKDLNDLVTMTRYALT